MKHIFFTLILTVLTSLGGCFSLHSQYAAEVKKHTMILAADSLEGRGPGTAGIRKAADHISGQFEKMGLYKGYPAGYFQEFYLPEGEVPEVNVIGFLPATIPTSRSLVFTAHYDGLGIQPGLEQEDVIFNGARDNAVGVGALIALAQMYAQETNRNHNLVFIATAGEEFGQHGSRAYLQDPLFPSEQVIICLNIDGFNVSGPREDYFMMPRQGINFASRIQGVLDHEGWIYDSPDWVDGMNTMFDTAVFLEHGIPAITIWTGTRIIGGGEAPEKPLGSIHSPEDEVNEYWDWSGVDSHLQIYKTLGDHFMEHHENLEVTDPALFRRSDPEND